MYDIQLRKGGKLFVKSWSTRHNDYREEEVEYEYLSSHLHDPVCFDRDVRLKDVFLLMSRDVELFSGAASCPFLSEFVEEAMLPTIPSKARDSGLGSLIVEWVATSEEDGNWHEEAHLYIYPTIRGVGAELEFDLGTMRINEISMLPIVLDTNLEIIDRKTEEIIFEGIKPYSLLEMSKAVLDELGANPPDFREFMNSDMLDEVAPDINEKINRCIEEHNKIKPCKMCGNDTKSYHFRKPDDVCGKCFEKMRGN